MRVKLITMAIALLCSAGLQAEIRDSGYCGAEGDGSNISWRLEYSNGEYVLTIEGTGKMKNYSSTGSICPWSNWINNIDRVVIADGVTSLGTTWDRSYIKEVEIAGSVDTLRGFGLCTYLKKVTIHDGVEVIDDAFRGYNALREIVIPGSVKSLSGFNVCTNLEKVTIHDGVEVIDNAFQGCEALREIVIPGSVKSLSGFRNCDILKKVTIQDGVEVIDDAFYGCELLNEIEIPGSVKRLDGFHLCTYLKKVTIHDGVEVIDAFNGNHLTEIEIPGSVDTLRGFGDCDYLEKVTIHDGVKVIDDAFGGCDALKEIVIPGSVKSLNGFNGCTSLEKVTIHDGVEVIEGYAFGGCDALKGIEIPGSVKSLSGFRNAGLENVTIPGSVKSLGGFDGCKNLENVTIQDGVEVIEENAFSGCDALREIVIPGSVKSLNGFNGCTNLEKVTIHDGVEVIEEKAFYGCDALRGIEIPGSVKTLNGFMKCAGLENLTIQNGVEQIAENAFDSCNVLRRVTIPGSIKILNGFMDCTGLQNATVQEGVEVIGENAFRRCEALREIVIPGSVKSLGGFRNAGLENVIIQDGVEVIEENAFYGCYDLKEIVIPGSVKSLSGFSYCHYLEKVTIQDGVKVIEENAFSGCDRLTDVTVPGNITNLSVLAKCESLNKLTLTGNAESMESGAFKGHQKLTEVSVCGGVIGDEVFRGCERLKTLTLLNSVTHIGEQAFYDCSKLTEVLIPIGVTSIGADAFTGCIGLKEVTFMPREAPEYNDGLDVLFAGSLNTVYVSCLSGYEEQKLWNDNMVGEVKELEMSVHVWVKSADSSRGSVSVEQASSWCEPTATVTAEANRHWEFVRWVTEDGEEVSRESTYSFDVTESISLVAEFAAEKFEVTAEANDGVMGTVSGGGEYEYLSEAVLVAEAHEGYRFVKWSDGATENPRRVTVTGDAVYTAEFAAEVYTITAEANDGAMGAVNGGGEYGYMSEAVLVAEANDGYRFVKWSDGETENPRRVTVTEDAAYTAEFAAEVYTVTAEANDGAMGAVSGGGEYEYLSEAVLVAEANEGYRFVKWSDGETENPRRVTVTGDAAYTAEFAAEVYTVTAEANDGTMGAVSGGGEYEYLSEAVLVAEANEGYRFVKWSDGVTENPRTVTVTGDMTFTAEFAPVTAIEGVEADEHLTVYCTGMTICAETDDRISPMEVYDTSGRCIYRGEERCATVAQRGVYIVRVGRREAKTVVR